MSINRRNIIKAVNESLIARGSNLRVRYSATWKEYKVIDCVFLPADARIYFTTSMVDAIETADFMHKEHGY